MHCYGRCQQWMRKKAMPQELDGNEAMENESMAVPESKPRCATHAKVVF
jgi:hypothetical protein